ADITRHVAAARDDQDGLGPQFVGHDHGAFDQFLARSGQVGVLEKVRAAAAFDARGDAVENLDAFERIFADGGFAAEHDGVGLLEHGVGDIRDLGARRHGRFNHAFEHVRGDDDGFADPQARFDDAALDDGQFLIRDFDAEVAARDHDAVGFLHDGFQVGDGLLVFDFGDDERVEPARLEKFPQLKQIAGFADERKGDQVHARFESEPDVLDVLGGERGQADFDAGQVDVAAAAQFAGRENFTLDLVAVLGEHLHFDGAVVNEHHVADVDVVDKIGVVHVHGAFLLAAFAADGEGEFLAGLQIERHADVAGADGRTLGVHHDADVDPARGGRGADVLDQAADPIMRRVGHVEAEDVYAGVHELAEHFRGLGRRAEGGDDFRFAQRVRFHRLKNNCKWGE